MISPPPTDRASSPAVGKSVPALALKAYQKGTSSSAAKDALTPRAKDVTTPRRGVFSPRKASPRKASPRKPAGDQPKVTLSVSKPLDAATSKAKDDTMPFTAEAEGVGRPAASDAVVVEGKCSGQSLPIPDAPLQIEFEEQVVHEEALHIEFEETESKEHDDEDEDEDEGHSPAADDMAEYVQEVEHDYMVDAAADDAAHRRRLDIDALRLHRSPDVEIAIKWRRRFSVGMDAAELVVSPCSANSAPFSPAASSLNRSRFNSTASDDAMRSGSEGAVLSPGSDEAVLSPHQAEPAAQVEGHRTDPPKPSSSLGLDDTEEESPKPNHHVANVYSQPFAGSTFFGGLALRPSQTLQKRMSLVMLPTTPLGTPASPDNAASAEYAWS